VNRLKWAARWFAISLFSLITVALLLPFAIQIWRTFVPPDDAYFERFMNKKLAGYNETAGRRLKCTSEKIYRGYQVDCQYFRDGVGEEFTYHWFEDDGSYISTLNGG
jgi:hypothetical protein